MSARGLPLVVFREALRQSRRWQTWALRLLFACALLAVVFVVGDPLTREADTVAQTGELGRSMFYAFVGVQLFLVSLVAPPLVAVGVLEEKDDRTLDLLVISHLQATDILWGKVGSRLLTLVGLILAGVPALSLITTLGGVSPWEVVNATSGTLLVAVLLGSVAGFVALLADRPLVPVGVSIVYGLIVVLGIPSCALEPSLIQMTNPYLAATSSNPWSLLVWLMWLPVLIQIVRLGGPVLRIITTDDSEAEFGLMSPDFWVLQRIRRRLSILAFVVGIVPIAVIFVVNARLPVPDPPEWVLVLAGFVWLSAFLYLVTAGVLLGTLALTRASKRLQADRARSLVRHAERSNRSRPVWSNPVLWREVSRTGPRPVRGTVFAVAWLTLVGLGALMDDEVPLGIALFGAWLTVVVTPALVTTGLVEERRRRTLGLLWTTPMRSVRIVFGKTLGPLAVLLGLLTAVYLTAFATMPSFEPQLCEHEHLMGSNVGRGSALLLVSMLGWHLAVLLALAACMVPVALKIRPLALAWPVALAVPFVWMGGFPLTMAICRDLGLRLPRGLELLWLPFGPQGGVNCNSGGVPLAMLASTGAYVVVALLLLAIGTLVVSRMRRSSS